MQENRFLQAVKRKNVHDRPPVWFMRQAGRYHARYRKLREQYSFLEVCKNPRIACEATVAPVEEFGFDAAVLFSDILFPLEALGMKLGFNPGPELSGLIKNVIDLRRLKPCAQQVGERLGFQAEALKLIRARLDETKGLIGFVGGPLTLFWFAVGGSHKGPRAESAANGFEDGRFDGFCDLLTDGLAQAMRLQATAGADAIAIFDTCAGEVSPDRYRRSVVPVLERLLGLFRKECPETPVIYYSKGTDDEYWNVLKPLSVQCLGVDWHSDLRETLEKHHEGWSIQGNMDPQWLILEHSEMERNVRGVFLQLSALPREYLKGWVCGLGHGILPNTPEKNVHLFLKIQHEVFS